MPKEVVKEREILRTLCCIIKKLKTYSWKYKNTSQGGMTWYTKENDEELIILAKILLIKGRKT
jgi:hypothetical protein